MASNDLDEFMQPTLGSSATLGWVSSWIAGCCFLSATAAAVNPTDLAHPEPKPAAGIVSPVKGDLAAVSGRTLTLAAGDKVSIQIQQRKDLSGDYVIKADGSLVIPFVGTIMAEERTPEEVENELSLMLQSAGGVPSLLSVDVSEWRPVYVVGSVDKPGAFAFKPRMTALHALALAGGTYRAPFGAAILDASREGWQRKQTIAKLKTALARQARLEAEKGASGSIAVPDQLRKLATKAEAEALIAGETRLKQQRAETFSNVAKSNTKGAELAKIEVNALQEELGQVSLQIKLVADNLSDLARLEKSGLTTNIRLNELRRQSADLEGEKRRIQSNIARAQQNLTVLERERNQFELERTQKIDQELSTTQDEVRMLRDSASASEDAIDRMSAAVRSDGGAIEPTITYTVIRRERDNIISLPIEETSELRPGDTLKVSVSGAARADRVAPVPTD